MNFGLLFVSLCYLPLISSEGDPIPEEIYELLRDSSVHSIRDLQQVLQIESVDEDTSSSYMNFTQMHVGENRVPLSRGRRSLAGAEPIEPAVIAECKTRSEVFEISRSMVDSTNANFLVWPPCVEVQRCTGCCNTRAMQCRPTQVRVRHIQVNKIEVAEKKAVFNKAIVALEDHLACRCEPVSPRLPSRENSREHRGEPPHKNAGRQKYKCQVYLIYLLYSPHGVIKSFSPSICLNALLDGQRCFPILHSLNVFSPKFAI
ncbi:platelet-derived growth factor subunit B [Crotalus adamanteus]|uniref:Platelet-derived growth factor subunit B n=1 Tax=Crotalus adamanteus TaxID=8729 RepID=A0AAW1BEN0_CROAD